MPSSRKGSIFDQFFSLNFLGSKVSTDGGCLASWSGSGGVLGQSHWGLRLGVAVFGSKDFHIEVFEELWLFRQLNARLKETRCFCNMAICIMCTSLLFLLQDYWLWCTRNIWLRVAVVSFQTPVQAPIARWRRRRWAWLSCEQEILCIPLLCSQCRVFRTSRKLPMKATMKVAPMKRCQTWRRWI